MRLHLPLAEGLLAVAIAAVALILAPGVAIVALVAALALLLCGVTLLRDRRIARRRPGVPRAGRRAPSGRGGTIDP